MQQMLQKTEAAVLDSVVAADVADFRDSSFRRCLAQSTLLRFNYASSWLHLPKYKSGKRTF